MILCIVISLIENPLFNVIVTALIIRYIKYVGQLQNSCSTKKNCLKII
jgi:hypothetical protein